MSWYEEIKEKSNRSGYTIDAYHGTGDFKGNQFDRDLSGQGVFWFSESKSKIESGESGAVGFSDVLHVKLKSENPAGWDEYDRYFLEQIKDMGFDSIHLDDDWIVFEPEQIKLAEPITYDNQGNPIPLEKRFDPSNPDMRY